MRENRKENPPRATSETDLGSVDFAVLGGGIAGLTAAHDLTLAGAKVAVIDRAEECGGTHRSAQIGPYTFDAGSMFFEPRHPMFSMFDGLKPRFHEVFRSERRIVPDGRVLRYPFEPKEALGWPLRTQMVAAGDMVWHRMTAREGDSAEAFCLSRLGRTAYDRSGLRYYIDRFHQRPAAEIDTVFCRRRMNYVMAESRWSSLAQKAWRSAARRPAPKAPRRPLLVRPKAGFAEIYGEIRRQLQERGVAFHLGAELQRIATDDVGVTVETGAGRLRADRAVGAMPVEALHVAAFGESAGLASIDLLTLYVSAGDLAGFDSNVLFNFHRDGAWKRATIYSRLYGRAAGRDYFAVEVTRPKGDAADADTCFDDFRRHVRGLGLFSNDLRLEGCEIVRDAYPLYRHGSRALVDAATQRLCAARIHGVGRQGQFEYLPISARVVGRTRAHMRDAGLV